MLRGPSHFRVYVMLGFHTSFYHSWRGDTPDEAGFGTDIRIVREILRLLNQANRSGSQARGYWDFDVYWTLERILPRYAPDIIDGIRRRVQARQDEIVLGPYNNGANHAATERELRTAIAYAIENPSGSGLRQVFGRASSLFRPQEGMLTAGQSRIYLEEGVTGLALYYAGVPFNCLSTFVAPLPPEQRYGLLWLRCRPDEPPIELWPCISPPDLLEETCLEALLLKLRRLQESGRVRSDLLVHLNFDADAESWLPVQVPRSLRWFPNTGGLQEYIRVVDRYPWAQFTVPSEYRLDHAPRGEVLVRQDLADGGFDGNYSWAEKYTSLLNWTELERSRLHTYRAEALLGATPETWAGELRKRLWEGPESAFFGRLVGLSTTHFGMSTPVINVERQARAVELLEGAKSEAAAVERAAALALQKAAVTACGDSGSDDFPRIECGQTPELADETGGQILYRMEVYRPAFDWVEQGIEARTIVRLPVTLAPDIPGFRLQDAQGRLVPASLVDVCRLVDGRLAGDLLFPAPLKPGERRRYCLQTAPRHSSEDRPRTVQTVPSPGLRNRWLDLRLSPETGIGCLTFEGHEFGCDDFLSPFIAYRSKWRPRVWSAPGYTFESLGGEKCNKLSRARISTKIVMDTRHGPVTSKLQYTFTLSDDFPYLLVDVEAEYASTPSEDTIRTIQQSLGRLLDLRWTEVAPFQLNPRITAPAGQPLRIWKHNYEGVTACYDLNYGVVNPRNCSVDSLNHQVTAGWLAVSNGRIGLLLAENAAALSSLAFCPMRLRERDGLQHLSLNPFGSYYGRQMDYRHLGGCGVGAELTAAASGALRPNGPSFNGQRLAFSLLLAPYVGDSPPAQLQADALAFFYPPGVIYLQSPEDLDLAVIEDARRYIASEEIRSRPGNDLPLPMPRALLPNPSEGAVALAWEIPHDPRVTACEIRWCAVGDSEWQQARIPAGDHWQVTGLENGKRYRFQVRSASDQGRSEWTRDAAAIPGQALARSLLSAVPLASPWTLVRLVFNSLAHVIRAWLARRTA